MTSANFSTIEEAVQAHDPAGSRQLPVRQTKIALSARSQISHMTAKIQKRQGPIVLKRGDHDAALEQVSLAAAASLQFEIRAP